MLGAIVLLHNRLWNRAFSAFFSDCLRYCSGHDGHVVLQKTREFALCILHSYLQENCIAHFFCHLFSDMQLFCVLQ